MVSSERKGIRLFRKDNMGVLPDVTARSIWYSVGASEEATNLYQKILWIEEVQRWRACF
jgi:hypothetical protein